MSSRRRRTPMSNMVPNFCESTSPDQPNHDVFSALLEQVGCMYERLATIRADVHVESQFSEELCQFQDKIQCLEAFNGDLEKEIARLNAALTKALDCLAEESQLRESLECEVAELRQEINQIDQNLCNVTAERNHHLTQIENMCRRLQECQTAYATLENERDELFKSSVCSKVSSNKNESFKNDLQRALADCCREIDKLTKQVACLTAEVNRANRERDDLLRERDELARKLNCLREKYDNSKCVDDQLIEKLKDEVKCLEMQKASACQKFNHLLKAHHEELDRINGEKIRFENAYEEEKRKREELERKLRDCEEKKKRGEGGGGIGGPGGWGSSGGGSFGRNPHQSPSGNENNNKSSSQCDQYKADILKLEQKKAELENSRKCLEEQLIQITSKNVAMQSSINDKEQQFEHLKEMLKQYEKRLEELQQTHEIDTETRLQLQEQEMQAKFLALQHELDNNKVIKPDTLDFSQVVDLNADANANATTGQEDDEKVELIKAKQTLKRDVKKLKKMVNERDEHIASLQTCTNDLKKKFSEQYNQLAFHKAQLDQFKTIIDGNENALQIDREKLIRDVEQFRQDQLLFDSEKQAHLAALKHAQNDKTILENLGKMKDRIQGEVVRLKEAISKQFIDKTDLDQLKASYEIQLTELGNKFENQLEMNRQLAEINEQLGKQFKDRDLINTIRDSNELILRKELNTVINASKSDAEKFKRIINERDEEVDSLRKAISHLRHKYVSASTKNEELLKRVQILASTSKEDCLDLDSGMEINENG